MTAVPKIIFREKIILALGDILVLFVSIWLTITIRSFSLPTFDEYYSLVGQFLILFIIWLIVFFIVGMYEAQTMLTKSRVPKIIIVSQVTNIIATVIFFYFASQYQFFGITPKTNLLIYCIVSTSLLAIWRLYIYNWIAGSKRVSALLIGSGAELAELKEEVNDNSRYPFFFETVIDFDNEADRKKLEEITQRIGDQYSVIVLDVTNPRAEPILSDFYGLTFSGSGKTFIEFVRLYEEIFRRIPLSSLNHQWFLLNISVARKNIYDAIKRLMDIVFSGLLSIILFILYPFVALAIKIEDNGEVLITQERVGENGKLIYLQKFRSMTGNEDGVWVGAGEGAYHVTKVGMFLRKSRIDELPQLMSVFKGDISLIGPRPDIKGLNDRLSEEIPYYEVRNIVKPGLSGWAQVTQEGRPPQTVDETKLRLSYDFYYIKHRSAWLDLSIALKTIKTLLMRVGV